MATSGFVHFWSNWQQYSPCGDWCQIGQIGFDLIFVNMRHMGNFLHCSLKIQGSFWSAGLRFHKWHVFCCFVDTICSESNWLKTNLWDSGDLRRKRRWIFLFQHLWQYVVANASAQFTALISKLRMMIFLEPPPYFSYFLAPCHSLLDITVQQSLYLIH